MIRPSAGGNMRAASDGAQPSQFQQSDQRTHMRHKMAETFRCMTSKELFLFGVSWPWFSTRNIGQT